MIRNINILLIVFFTATMTQAAPCKDDPTKDCAKQGETQTIKPHVWTASAAKAPKDAVVSKTGLASKVLVQGTGTKHPKADDNVIVHYTLWTQDGRETDSSVKRGRTANYPMNMVIKGWSEGLQLMVEGETRRLWIPSNLAYGDKPKNKRFPGGPLVVDVQLIKIK